LGTYLQCNFCSNSISQVLVHSRFNMSLVFNKVNKIINYHIYHIRVDACSNLSNSV